MPLTCECVCLSLNVERLRSIGMKYNSLLEQMEVEERDLFQNKLNQIDQVRLSLVSFSVRSINCVSA